MEAGDSLERQAHYGVNEYSSRMDASTVRVGLTPKRWYMGQQIP